MLVVQKRPGMSRCHCCDIMQRGTRSILRSGKLLAVVCRPCWDGK